MSNKIPVEATRWFKNGDHPKDDVYCRFEDSEELPVHPREGKIVRYYRIPGSSSEICQNCGRSFHEHGFIDNGEGQIVCPGDWIITGVNGRFYACSQESFEDMYEIKTIH